jgi:hypothetical protein
MCIGKDRQFIATNKTFDFSNWELHLFFLCHDEFQFGRDKQSSALKTENKSWVIVKEVGVGLENHIKRCLVILKQNTLLKRYKLF